MGHCKCNASVTLDYVWHQQGEGFSVLAELTENVCYCGRSTSFTDIESKATDRMVKIMTPDAALL